MKTEEKLFTNFYRRWEEVTEVAPQTMGPLTPLYKKVIPVFKTAPWRIIVPVSFLVVMMIALLHEVTAADIASLLQAGF
ncbi:hypothetical protein C4579_01450 [Candidatus Microgenomates bacterium]|nr:MAG: hypothetical protein C4579_01450 [Candidatus Microgenomates bacterium]